MRTLVMIAIAWTLSTPALADEPEHDLSLAPGAVLRDAPPVSRVLDAAYAAAGLDRDPGRGFVRRARLAGLVPWISVRTARDTAWRELEPDVGRSTTIDVRATWRLDRLVFDGRELQVASLEAARRRERRRLANHVIRLYFVWRRAAVGESPRAGARAREAAAELDALTEGWFSAALRPTEGDSEN